MKAGVCIQPLEYADKNTGISQKYFHQSSRTTSHHLNTKGIKIKAASVLTWHRSQLRGHVPLCADLLPGCCGKMIPPELPEQRVVFVLWAACLIKVWVVASKHIQVGAVCYTAVSTAGRRNAVSCGGRRSCRQTPSVSSPHTTMQIITQTSFSPLNSSIRSNITLLALLYRTLTAAPALWILVFMHLDRPVWCLCRFSTFSQKPVGDPQVWAGRGEDAPGLKPPCSLLSGCKIYREKDRFINQFSYVLVRGWTN